MARDVTVGEATQVSSEPSPPWTHRRPWNST
jgi:hypothetical protein